MPPDSHPFITSALTEKPTPIDGIDGAHWCVIYTKPRQETRALENLQQQGFEVYLPLHQSERLQRGKLRLVEEPLFKRYLFVRFDAQNSPWHTIRNTLGVSELVRCGGQLAKVPAALVQALKQFQSTPQSLFQRGETLRVTDGPFRDLQAVFEMQDGESRAIVLIELLNKMQKISVSISALCKQA